MNDVIREWLAKADGDFRTAQRELAAIEAPNLDAVCSSTLKSSSEPWKGIFLNFSSASSEGGRHAKQSHADTRNRNCTGTPLIDEVMDFVKFVKAKSIREGIYPAIASESSLKKDWLCAEEDKAWGDL